MQWFYVFNKPTDSGFHEIKDSTGNVIAEAADTDDEQVRTTLNESGITGAFDYEYVYDDASWDTIGRD